MGTNLSAAYPEHNQGAFEQYVGHRTGFPMIYVVQCLLLAAASAQRGSDQKQGTGGHHENMHPYPRGRLSKKKSKLLGFDGYLVLYDEFLMQKNGRRAICPLFRLTEGSASLCR